MITRFSERSIYTVRIKNKLTLENYKIFPLYNADYIYTFIFIFRI